MRMQVGEGKVVVVKGGEVCVGVQVRLQVGDRPTAPGHRGRQRVLLAGHDRTTREGHGIAVDLRGRRRGGNGVTVAVPGAVTGWLSTSATGLPEASLVMNDAYVR